MPLFAFDRELLQVDHGLFKSAIAASDVVQAHVLWRGHFLDRFTIPGAPGVEPLGRIGA